MVANEGNGYASDRLRMDGAGEGRRQVDEADEADEADESTEYGEEASGGGGRRKGNESNDLLKGAWQKRGQGPQKIQNDDVSQGEVESRAQSPRGPRRAPLASRASPQLVCVQWVPR